MPMERTSTPTSRGQFNRLGRVGNISANDFDGTFDSVTGDTFDRRDGYHRRTLKLVQDLHMKKGKY